MLNQLKIEVLKANLELVQNGLVIYTWGNVSAIDRKSGFIAIKPSGIDYKNMTLDDIVIVDLDGNTIEGELKPSVDLMTHIMLYKKYPFIGGVAHTHSTYATAFAQAQRNIKPYGTTHADYFYGDIPCVRGLKKEETSKNYELNTGVLITKEISKELAQKVPACIVGRHGLFSWGKNAEEAVYHATVAEQCAKMAFITELINPKVTELEQFLLDKHYTRKHGEKATYGQRGKS